MITESWNSEIDRLEQFFKGRNFPDSIKTTEGLIFDVKRYAETDLIRAKANAGNDTFLSSIRRLQELEIVLQC